MNCVLYIQQKSENINQESRKNQEKSQKSKKIIFEFLVFLLPN